MIRSIMTEPVEKTFLNDTGIRLALRSSLLLKHSQESDTIFIDELGLCRGQARVDVAVVNGVLHGYEIKSDRDSLRRLQSQVALYSKVLELATLVVTDRYLPEARDKVP